MQADSLAAMTEIWDWLREIPDPEIPAISIVDLGIVRDIEWDLRGEMPQLVVNITPTYSGCPATEVIFEDIRRKLEANGIHHPKLQKKLSPAWTTDWMEPVAREKLRGYGIAPPTEQVIDISRILRRHEAKPMVRCPQCNSSNTEIISEFGSTPCKALYRCLDCREPFDHFKRH